MKDFAEEYLHTDDFPVHNDPYLYTTPQVREELLEMQGMALSFINSGHLAALILTAPLTAITASLQLSVKPHKAIYEAPVSQSTQLAKVNTAITLQEKRRMELMIRSGGERRPYTAPVYEGYRGVWRGLTKQGWKAFFKGFLWRSVHQMGHFFAFYEIALLEGNRAGLSETLSVTKQIVKMWILQLACDVSLNMFHIAENRYILQNSIPEFQGTPSLTSSLQERFQGHPQDVQAKGDLHSHLLPLLQLLHRGLRSIPTLPFPHLLLGSSHHRRSLPH